MSKNRTRRRRRTTFRARQDLQALLRDPPPVTGLAEPGARWHRLYTRRICRYLLESLDDLEMRAWEVAFTALHELVGRAWSLRPADAPGLGDVEAWALVSAEEHLAIAQVITLMPECIDVTLLVPHLRGFIRFLATEGAMTFVDAERLDHEYAFFDPSEVRVVA